MNPPPTGPSFPSSTRSPTTPARPVSPSVPSGVIPARPPPPAIKVPPIPGDRVVTPLGGGLVCTVTAREGETLILLDYKFLLQVFGVEEVTVVFKENRVDPPVQEAGPITLLQFDRTKPEGGPIEQVRWTLGSYLGNTFISIRVWRQARDGTWGPTGRGATLRLGEINEVVATLLEVNSGKHVTFAGEASLGQIPGTQQPPKPLSPPVSREGGGFDECRPER